MLCHVSCKWLLQMFAILARLSCRQAEVIFLTCTKQSAEALKLLKKT